MLKTVSQSAPTNHFENGVTGVQDPPVNSVGNPFTGAMNNLSGAGRDAQQTASSDWNTDIFQVDSSNQNADIFQATPSYENTNIFQTVTSSWNTTGFSRTFPSSPQVDIFQPHPSSVETHVTEFKPSTVPFGIFQSTEFDQNVDIFQKPKPAVPKRPDASAFNLKSNTPVSQSTPSEVSSISSQQKDSPVSDSSWLHGLQVTPSALSDACETPSFMKDNPFAPSSRASTSSPQVEIFQPVTEIKSSSRPFEVYQSPPSSQEADIFEKPKPEVPERPNVLKLRLRNDVPFTQKTPSPASSHAFQTPSSMRDIPFGPIQNNVCHEFFSDTPSSVTPDLFRAPSTHSSIFQPTPFSQVLSLVQPSHTARNPFHPTPNGKPSFGGTEKAAENMSTDREVNIVLTTPGGTERAACSNTPSDVTNGTISSSSQEHGTPISTASEFSRVKETVGVVVFPVPDSAVILQEAPTQGEEGSPSDVNIVLSGEERCVEDWPEDSPQLASNWKPSGTLRLRRESILDKLTDDSKLRDNGALYQRSEQQSGTSTLTQELQEGLLIDVCSSDNGEDQTHGEGSKWGNKLKFKSSKVLRRKSKEKLSIGQNTPENHLALELYEGPVGQRAGSVFLPTNPITPQWGVDTNDGVFSPTTPIISEDTTEDDMKATSVSTSQKRKVPKKRLSSLHRRTLRDKQYHHHNIDDDDDDDSLHQDLEEVPPEEAPSPFSDTPTWPKEEQELHESKDIFVPHDISSKDNELHAQDNFYEHKEWDYDGVHLPQENAFLHEDAPPYEGVHHEHKNNGLHLPQEQAFLDEDPPAYGEAVHHQQDYNGMHLPQGKAFLDEDPPAYKNTLHQKHNHNEYHLPPEKAFLDEDTPQKETLHQETYEEEEQRGKQKKKRKSSVKITVPHLTWRHSNNHHTHGGSPGMQSRDYDSPQGAEGYNSPDSTKSDYYFSASPKERHLFPAAEEESLKFTSMEDYLGSSPAHNSTDFFTTAEKQTMTDRTDRTMQYCKPKKPSKFGIQRRRKSKDKFFEHGSRHSGSDYQPSPQFQSDPMEDEFFREDADVFMEGRYGKADTRKTEENYGTEFLENNFPEKCTIYEEDDGLYGRDPSPGKKKKSRKISVPHMGRKNSRSKSQQYDDPPGATSSDYYMSDAAKVEWRSSQMDMRRTEEYEDRELEELPEEDEGDTDSLMEWWNTVEMWDEVPSDEESTLKEEEIKTFTQLADKVHHGLRVFNKVFMENAEVLYQHVLILHAIADDLSNFHRRAKVGSITGGTTMAVGGAAAITGLALAPLTLGASLLVSAVGLGVLTAGGVTSASAAISDKVNDAHDRKKIELVAGDYLTRLTEVARCLGFVREGMCRLSRHPLLRRNNYYASSDWEVRRALQMVSLVREPADQAAAVAERGTAALSGLFKHMERYFVDKNGKQELRKTCKKEATGQVHSVATLLQEGLTELNSIREQMLDAYGNI
ncbi:hypothetical protein ACEWY4_024910 [Coilia grayii]|uniref:Uncharacterized protein n=1 Tax=Coilia grayii TaxID=363190 RepID=A0ABD1IW25_9TELE